MLLDRRPRMAIPLRVFLMEKLSGNPNRVFLGAAYFPSCFEGAFVDRQHPLIPARSVVLGAPPSLLCAAGAAPASLDKEATSARFAGE